MLEAHLALPPPRHLKPSKQGSRSRVDRVEPRFTPTSTAPAAHGAPAARGGVLAPDLLRSLLVLDDEKGILIAPVLRDGRPDAGMPKPNLTEPQIADVVAWLHLQIIRCGTPHHIRVSRYPDRRRQKRRGLFRRHLRQLSLRNRRLEEGIGSRYDGTLAMQARWLQPRGGRGAAGGGREELAGAGGRTGRKPERDHGDSNTRERSESIGHTRPRRRFQRVTSRLLR